MGDRTPTAPVVHNPFLVGADPIQPAHPQQAPEQASGDVAVLQSELLQSRAQRKMLVKELKFVREQLAYHRRQLSRVEADRAEMSHDLHSLKLRVAQAEDDKTKVMTRSVAEKHMLANEINALEDTFMASVSSTDKQTALEQAQAQIVMLRKEVRFLRNQFVGVRQELTKERKEFEEQLAAKNRELRKLQDELEALQQQQQQLGEAAGGQMNGGHNLLSSSTLTTLSNGTATHSTNQATTKTVQDTTEESDDEELDAARLKKQRDMFEKENVALAKQVSQLQSRIQQLECEILRQEADLDSQVRLKGQESANGLLPSTPQTNTPTTAPPNKSGLSESVIHSQQDSVRLLKQMLDDMKRHYHDLQESGEANLNVMRGTVKELEENLVRLAHQNRRLVAENTASCDEVAQLQERLQEAEIERLMLENNDNLLGVAGRLSSTLATSAKNATSSAFFKLQKMQQPTT